MDRSCLLCVGSKSNLQDLISKRIDSGKKDFMKYAFAISMDESVSVSALRLTPEMKKIMPDNEFLHPGYCGEECRDLLIRNMDFKKEKNLYAIVGIESPGCGYFTYDIVFPQGRCDYRENSRDTAMREFHEETGISLDNSKRPQFLGLVGKKREMSVYVYHVK